jgi:hyperosmotically inducible protein
MNAADIDLTRKIRRALMDDKSLSTYAHNVKIITRDGMVTLRGPVRAEDERLTIELKAVEIAGKDHVISQLTIASKKGETN